MHKLLRAVTAVAFCGAGALALAGVAYLQANPLALTSPARSGSRPPEDPALRDSEQVVPYLPLIPEAAQVVDRRAVHPLGSARYESTVSSEQKRGATPPEPVRLAPCSDWIDMGPASLVAGGHEQRRRVRVLCPEGAPVSDYYHPTG